jgi:hypothetical protein
MAETRTVTEKPTLWPWAVAIFLLGIIVGFVVGPMLIT